MTSRGDSDTEAHVRAIVAAPDARRAKDLADAALRKQLRHPAFHAARARWHQLNNRHLEALNELKEALALAPSNADLLSAAGLSLLALGHAAKAVSAFDSAIHIAPASAQSHYFKGCAHAAAGDTAAALRSHEHAVALQPNHVDALAALAISAARGGEVNKSRPFAERALTTAPGHPTAALALSMCDLQEREFTHAEARLEALLPQLEIEDQTRALALGLLGDALDGQDHVDAAFEAFAGKNRILASLYKDRFGGDSRLVNTVERMIAGLNKGPLPCPEKIAPQRSPATRHVFLLGFMRSGTTLLHQVFASHPDVESLEERETLADLTTGGMAELAALTHLKSDDLSRSRATYWQRVRALGAKPDGKIFLEKQPFNILYLPLIATLFPSAKIIFVVRDPRDVIFSCFRRHLEVKPTTFELLTLQGAAHFYDRVIQLAETCRAKLRLDVHECRYEDIVSDFETRVRAMCRFLGMEWNEAMRAFGEGARSRTIRSVSSNQVRRGLYSEGVGQWRRYEKQLMPIFPILRPWVERFCYEGRLAGSR